VEAIPSAHVAATAKAQDVARRVHGVARDDEPASPYIGLVTRTIAFALDAAVINVAALLVWGVLTLAFSIFPPSQDRHDVAVVVGGAAFVLWVVGYFLAFWTTTGQTPGNRVLEIRVVRADGSPLRPRHALARLAGLVLAAVPLGLGFAPILVTDRRRGLQDWLAGTVVTAAPRRTA
jgi:uncharacterized RDD family membrane protein YckC